ncbi:helix-turn-helix domain-containing protein [Bacillus sp. A301a_S52]|jgi:carbohydrate diacid regulator|nr:helix-turn-helix domain-containing protein [Bacillus sp. A301a_S52]
MLSAEVAQNIVRRTMEILDYNINVMDEHGVIIGSGETERIGTVHEVARHIQFKKESIEITVADEHKWHGVKQGINLPVYFRGEIVGTVGITGPPNDVKGYGELVKMTAEMIIEQAFLLKQMQYDERLTREFVNQWVSGEGILDNSFLEKADMLSIDLAKTRGIILISHNGMTYENKRHELDKLEKALKPLLHKQDLLSLIKDTIVVVKTAKTDRDLLNTAKGWADYFNGQPLRLTTGLIYDSYSHIAYSYEQAVKTMEMSLLMKSEENVIAYKTKTVDVLFYHLLTHESIKRLPVDKPLLTHNQHADLLETLETFIKHDGSIIHTAKALFIHRNTLHYRLDKIYELTGKHPRRLVDLFYLYVSCVLKNTFS